jgi:hypothetical protein
VAEVEKDYWISAYDIKERLQSVIFSDSEPGEAPQKAGRTVMATRGTK